jgi:hypothetical protein
MISEVVYRIVYLGGMVSGSCVCCEVIVSVNVKVYGL